MKKTLTLVGILILVSGVAFAATVDTGTLTVYGEIVAGGATFSVTQTDLSNTSGDRVNLLSDDVKSTAAGYVFGKWEFNTVNPATAVTYTVTYDYDETLSNGTDDISYELLEYAEGATSGGTAKTASAGLTTTINAPAETTQEIRNIGFRLTATGESEADAAAASVNFSDTITITMTTL